jgi:spore germination cell wall hydrolase CwlJ-like protein
MSIATCKADGAQPLGTKRSAPKIKFGSTAKIAAAVLVAGATGAAVVALAPSFAPTVNTPTQAAFHTVRNFVPNAVGDPVGKAIDSKQMVRALLAKAGLRPNYDIHQLTFDQARRINTLMPAADAGPDAAKPFYLSVDDKEGRQALHCLTQAAYFEAAANGPDAQAGVVQVVLNRVRHPDFPKSVCGVVYQGSQRKTGCQFSFTCDGALNRGLSTAAWNEARKVAARALGGYVVGSVGASTYYHADYVFPYWAPTLVKMCTIGPHIFYRMAGEEGQAAYLTGKYAGGELRLSKAVLRAADGLARRGGQRAAEATLRLASAAKVVRVNTSPDGRIHAQLAHNDDARLNLAQTVQAPAPAAAAPASPAPVASVAVSSAPEA